MLTLDYEHEIRASAACVWAVIVDFEHYGDWNPFVTRCEAALEPGAPIVMQVDMGPFSLEQTEQVTRVEPETLFEYRMRPVGTLLYSRRQHHIIPLAGGVTRYRSYFELRGWLAPLVALCMGYFLRRGFKQMSAAVQCRAEQLSSGAS